MPPLLLANLALWWCIGDRFLSLRRGCRETGRDLLGVDSLPKTGILPRTVRAVLAIPDAERTESRVSEAMAPIRAQLEHHRVLIATLAGLAPLLGLLGTVTGMIGTFDALATMTMHAAGGGGIAGGVSEALVSTQMGLAVAIPGVLAGRYLNRRQELLEGDIDTFLTIATGTSA